FEATLARLRNAGVTIGAIDMAEMLTRLNEATHTVMHFEGARFHQQRFNEHGDRLADVANLVRDGLRISSEHYEDARQFIGRCQTRVRDMFKATPVILTPAATGPAPMGLAWTGDARMNAPWTALGTPAITIPMPVPEGLPLGLQLTADRGEDARVLQAA